MIEEQIQYLALDRIECLPQVRERFDENSILGLARSIQESERVLQPIRVRRVEDTFVCLDGERRLRAARKLGLTRIPVIIEDKDLSPAEILQRQLVLDCQKEHLTAVERAKAIQALMRESGWSASQTAQRVGVSPATVTKLLAVLELPDATQDQVANGTLGMSTAYAIARTNDPDARTQLIDAASNGGLTRNTAVERSKRRKPKRSGSSSRANQEPRKDRVSLPLADGCTMTLIGKEIKVEMLVAWLRELIDRLALLETQNMAFRDAAVQLARPISG